ncbi:MAG TPA: hypothetical protein PKK94_20915, partial [Leptospiraceae bacterium]|nr:hypothetical protein [Leptospiraceae bacterium]
MEFKPSEGVSKGDAIAVGGFVNSCMTKVKGISVINRSDMKSVLNEQRLSQLGVVSGDDLKIGALISANKVLTGTVSKVAGNYYITGSLTDVNSGEINYSDKVKTNTLDNADIIADIFCNKFSSWNSGGSYVNPYAEYSSELKSETMAESQVKPSANKPKVTSNPKILYSSETDIDQYLKKSFEKKRKGFGIGPIYPLSLGNSLDVKVFQASGIGYSKSIKGIGFDAVLGYVEGDMTGFHGSFMFSLVGGTTKGVQASFAGVNYTGENFFGVNLVPGGISYVGGNMSGWQSTLVGLNIVGKTVWGLQATFGGYNSAQILDKSSWQIALVGINNVEENRGIQAGAIP